MVTRSIFKHFVIDISVFTSCNYINVSTEHTHTDVDVHIHIHRQTHTCLFTYTSLCEIFSKDWLHSLCSEFLFPFFFFFNALFFLTALCSSVQHRVWWLVWAVSVSYAEPLSSRRMGVLFTATAPHSKYLLNKYALNDWLPGSETLGHQASRHSTGPQIGRRHTPSPQPAPGHSSCVPPPGLFPPQPPRSPQAGVELTGTGWEVTEIQLWLPPPLPLGGVCCHPKSFLILPQLYKWGNGGSGKFWLT